MKTEVRGRKSGVRSGAALSALLFVICVSGHLSAQQPAIVNGPSSTAGASPIAMPIEYSKQIDALQEQSKKLDKDYEQVISLFKEYAAKRDAIQAQAAVLITRAALAAHLTIEQLDNSDLVKDEKGNYQWVARSVKGPVKAPAPKPQ